MDDENKSAAIATFLLTYTSEKVIYRESFHRKKDLTAGKF